ncbi:MAG TPA: vWA domain-containing protein [Methylophaga sp.]|nr:vWA domain-containing protein [Methylophaga sp.]
MRPICLILCLLSALLIMPVSAATPDVRVVIDVSGSMKQNDPQNLRAPGLRLLSGLLPPDSASGVWTFASQVNMLVNWQEIDNDWRDKANRQSQKIHSHGLFTNIEQALRDAIANAKTSSDRPRSIILLSDGLIDLQAGEKASQQSRQRIIDQLLPQLQKLNFKVHTIALSATADHELLEQLSLKTNGWYRQVDTADQLERVFLHLFEQATQRDNVPIKDNHFSIDKSIEEMTVLVFREAGSAAATLVKPDQQEITEKDRSDSIRWQHEKHYDLITIEQPMAGDWFIDAELDPDNRVMVVTDLQLRTNELPNNVLVGERFDMTATLTDNDKPIERKEFLELVDTELQQSNSEGEIISTQLSREPQQAVFRSELGQLFTAGRNDIVITAKGPTFERQQRQSINVVAVPLDIEINQVEGEQRSHRLSITADNTLLNVDSLKITALLTAADGSEFSYQVLRQDDNHWQLTLAELQPQTDYQLSLQIRGLTPEGRDVFLQPQTLTIKDDQQLVSVDSDVSEIEEPKTAETDAEIAPVTLPIDSPAEKPALSASMLLLLGNSIIVLLLLTGILLWRRYQQPPTPAEML